MEEEEEGEEVVEEKEERGRGRGVEEEDEVYLSTTHVNRRATMGEWETTQGEMSKRAHV